MSDTSSQVIINNHRVWSFYNDNKHLSAESVNLFFIDFFENIFNHATRDVDSNINSQLLSFMSEHNKQIEFIKSNLLTVNDTLGTLNSEISSNMISQFVNIKRDYIDDVKQIVSNSTLSSNDKIGSLLDRNNDLLLSKTTLLLSDIIPRTSEVSCIQIQNTVKQLHEQMVDESRKLIQSSSGEKALNDFISNFEAKHSLMLQTIQQPLYAFFTASENRINNNISVLKDSTALSMSTQNKLHTELGEFLCKYKNSTSKGKLGEHRLKSVLDELYTSADIQNTTGIKASGDFIMKRTDLPTILFENKEYDYNIPKDEVQKFMRDVENQNTNGVFISQYSGITFKQNFQIDINKGNVLVYIQHCEYTPEKIRLAVDIIDHLYVKIQDLNLDDNNTNIISKDILDDINDEYQKYITQKENMILILKDFNKKMCMQIDDIQFPVLEKYLSQKYATVKARCFVCDLCGDFTAKSKGSLSAHKRGCSKTHKPITEIVTTTTE
jgi:hypothetical protein